MVTDILQNPEGSLGVDTALTDETTSQVIAAPGGVLAGFHVTGITIGDHIILGVDMDDSVPEGSNEAFHMLIHKLDVTEVSHNAHIPVHFLQEPGKVILTVEQESLVFINGANCFGIFSGDLN